jgi:hypothetical protein
MKISFIVLVVAAAVTFTACGPHGPAYKDINTNQPAPPASSGAEGTPTALPPNSNAAPATGAQATAPAPPQTIKAPAFMDMTKGYPKDLPNYPQASVLNVQYGPIETHYTFSVSLQTHDAMDKISAFYDKSVKGNGWTVASRTVDPEYSEWVLKKADDNEAKVTVRKDKQSPRFIIVAARTSPQTATAAPKP